jgi:hypothetical protein
VNGAQTHGFLRQVKKCQAAGHTLHAEFSSVRSTHMLDLILVAAAIGFFALSVGYTIACDRL